MLIYINRARVKVAASGRQQALQADTMKLRMRYPKLTEAGDVPPYSETQTYCWAQIVHVRLRAWVQGVKEGSAVEEWKEEQGQLTHEQFKGVADVSGLE